MSTSEARECRAHPRTSMFVMATMSAPSASGPIRIRNMSLGGAMIEGAPLPPIGDPLHLRRGELAVTGYVVLCREGRAGMRFDCAVQVSDWLPSAAACGQQRVDQTFQALKAEAAGTAPTAPVAPAAPPLAPARPAPVAPAELVRTAAAIDELADVLAEDMDVVMRHGGRLQVLDLAGQVLRRLAGAGRPGV